ncbi:MAG: gephyrin-like molybdotransferase Glp [Chakrabartia sp.]
MISLEEAQARLLSNIVALPIETCPLLDANGRWAAANVSAVRTQPARNLSAMDGYAIAHVSFPGPWQVCGESAAGSPWNGACDSKKAVRIFTGAIIPDEYDCVIIQEDIRKTEDIISLSGAAAPKCGQHIRRAGSDFNAGTILIKSGDRMTAARIALAAMGGHGQVSVRRRVRVALLSTGNELVKPGEPVADHQIPSSNAPMLEAMLADLPADVVDLGIIADDVDAIAHAIRSADVDIIVTIGGASVGDHDLVKPALDACGATLDFWKVAMRPGKPVMAGKVGKTLVLGIPGNPVSAFVTSLLFLRPAICTFGGATNPLPARVTAILDGTLPSTGPRTDHIRGYVQNGHVKAIGMDDSAILVGLAQSNALIVRPGNSAPVKSGDTVEIIVHA